jgi:putative flippase GtrA
MDGNSSSHFNPLLDSIRIYYLLLKFIVASICSFAVDITLFTILIYLLKTAEPDSYIMISTVAARAVSAVFNYLLNQRKVFSSRGDCGKTAAKYAILWISLMMLSAVLVNQLYLIFPISETLIKMVVDTGLFLISFKIQHKWVFTKKATVGGYHELRKSKTVF